MSAPAIVVLVAASVACVGLTLRGPVFGVVYTVTSFALGLWAVASVALAVLVLVAR